MDWTLIAYLCMTWVVGYWIGSYGQYKKGVQYGSNRAVELIMQEYDLKPKKGQTNDIDN